MAGRIYLINGNSDLVSLEESEYSSEDLLQRLLADHPDLLAGEQINTDDPRRWLLVTREMAVPGEEAGAGRWSLDHLLLDQDGIPTLVEVKRSSDTRIRREVVGQMLEYAANAVAYWPIEQVRATFEARCEVEGTDPDEQLGLVLGTDFDVDGFWHNVKSNLQAGRIRLLFVADKISSELRRIVEFLNEQMDPAEVLAVEIKQFVGLGVKTLVPRVIGQTEAARTRKDGGRRATKQWNKELFFEELQRRQGDAEVNVARELLEWAQSRQLRIWWGQGARDGSFFPMYDNENGSNILFAVWTSGRIEFQFQHMANPPFDSEQKRRELADRLMEIEGLHIQSDALSRRPAVAFSVIADPAKLQQFLAIFDWVLEEYRRVETR